MPTSTRPPVRVLPPPEGERPPPRRKHRPNSRNLSTKAVFWLLAALLIAVPAVRLPGGGPMLALKGFVIEVVGIFLAAIIIARGEWSWRRTLAALTAAPNLAILAFLVWVAVSAARSELPQFSRYEAMRYAGGSLIYFGVVYGLSLRRHLSQLLDVLLIAGAAGAIMAFLNYGETDTSRLAGAFRNEQLLAGFLCILFPIVLVASQKSSLPEDRDQLWRHLAAQAVAVMLAAGILVSQNRSAWMGTALALVAIAALFWRFGGDGRDKRVQKHQVVVPLVMLVLAGGLFFYLSRTGSAVFSRVGTLAGVAQDGTYRWRRGMWDKAWRMTLKKPATGWGVGTFPVNQALYYHPDAPFRTQRTIVDRGPNLNDNAHNTYLQISAEMGFPGLALYLGIFAAFFVTALRAAPKIRRGTRQAMLFACVAAVLAQMVSAIGSPAWEFPEVSLFLWLVLGLGMAAAGVGERGREAEEDSPTYEN